MLPANAISAYGKTSTIARALRAALSQPGALGAVRFYGVGVAPAAAGTAATVRHIRIAYLLIASGTPSPSASTRILRCSAWNSPMISRAMENSPTSAMDRASP